MLINKSTINFLKVVIREQLETIYRGKNRSVTVLPNGNIQKITNDKIEYENALSLIKNPSDVFIKYYSANQMADGRYELTMERITPLDDKDWDIVDLIQNSLGSVDYMLDNNRRNNFIKEIKYHPEYYDDFASLSEVLNFINLLYKMYLEGKKRGIALYDLRPQNIGKDASGHYVHFDLGAG